jgi:hypothetical protein
MSYATTKTIEAPTVRSSLTPCIFDDNPPERDSLNALISDMGYEPLWVARSVLPEKMQRRLRQSDRGINAARADGFVAASVTGKRSRTRECNFDSRHNRDGYRPARLPGDEDWQPLSLDEVRKVHIQKVLQCATAIAFVPPNLGHWTNQPLPVFEAGWVR